MSSDIKPTFPAHVSQGTALEALRTFIIQTRTEDPWEELTQRNALNALNYLENWCLRTPNTNEQ